MSLEARRHAVAEAIERELAGLLPAIEGASARLAAAMRHAVLGGGKRLRALLVDLSGELFDVARAARLRVGAAVELLHAYSLVHDDLPAMDDAELRRGRPACHRVFGEATAILAGDALQSLAFEALAREDWPACAEIRCRLVAELAAAAGALGMCGGQMMDLEAEHRALEEREIFELEQRKTGALIRFSARAGAILAGAGEAERSALDRYAAALGVLFQIRDDLLDLLGSPEVIGKDAGRDRARGKATLVDLLGVEGAGRRMAELRREAEEALGPFGERALLLRQLVALIESRSS